MLGRFELQCPTPSISRKHATVEIVKNRLTIVCEHNNGITVDTGKAEVRLQKGQKIPLKAGYKLLFGLDDDMNKWFQIASIDPPLDQPVGRAQKRKQPCDTDVGKRAKKGKPTDEKENSNKGVDAEKVNDKESTTGINDNNNDKNANDGLNGRKSCVMGANCNHRRSDHFTELAHPGDTDFTVDRTQTKSKPGAPRCRYGKTCYRVNADHWEDYAH